MATPALAPVPVPVPAPINWGALVAQIQAGDKSAMERLYQLFSRGIRYYLARELGPHELEDKVHDAFLVVVKEIRRGNLREPERLMGFVRTIVRRQIADSIGRAVEHRRAHADLECGVPVADRQLNPEQGAIARQRAALIEAALRALSARDREILVRFYLSEQSPEQICREMRLSATQFRLVKSRAKARLGEAGRRILRVSAAPRERLKQRARE